MGSVLFSREQVYYGSNLLVFRAVETNLVIDLPVALKGDPRYLSNGAGSLPLSLGSIFPDPFLCEGKGINGLSVDNHPYFVVSVPFTRDYFFSGGSKVTDLTGDPKWSDEDPLEDLQGAALTGLFSVGSKDGSRRLSSSIGSRVAKLDIHFSSVDAVTCTMVLECSGGRNLPDRVTPLSSGFGQQVLVFAGIIYVQANRKENTFLWVTDLALTDFLDPAPGNFWGLSLDSNVDTQVTPKRKTVGGSGCLHRRLGVRVYLVGYELGFQDLGDGNIFVMLASIPDNVLATVISEKEMLPENETEGKTMEVAITHCYYPLRLENSGSDVDAQAMPKTKTAGGIGLPNFKVARNVELVPSLEPLTMKKIQMRWFSVSEMFATGGCFFLQVGHLPTIERCFLYL